VIKIACDNQISKRTVDKLEIRFEVVLRADNEPDELWIEKAIDLGANVFISPDIDVPLILDKNYPDLDYHWIDVKQGLASKDQYAYLLSKIKDIQK
jgi:hypothetical protein